MWVPGLWDLLTLFQLERRTLILKAKEPEDDLIYPTVRNPP